MELELKSVVRRIYTIAQDFYQNDIHTHIQAIYNRLNDVEQNVLLKGFIPYLFELETPPKQLQPVGVDDDEDFDVETFNQIEMIKLKSWIVKLLTIVASSIVLMLTLYILVRTLMPDNTDSLLKQIVDFVIYVIKF